MMRCGAMIGVVLPLALLVAGCISGKTPPTPSVKVTIAAGTYTLGLSDVALACDVSTPELGRCDVASSSDSAAYAAQLSWVPNVSADLPAFRIDATEVTNAQYALCVDSEVCSEPAYTEAAGIVDYYRGAATAELPVVWVSWKQAAAYCAFVGGRLPNEAEWEAAARSGATGGPFPWGSQPAACVDPADPNHVPFKDCHGPHAVGTAMQDRTPKQVFDLASNVREWVADGWRSDAYCDRCTRLGNTCSECAASSCAKGCNDAVDICPAKSAYSAVDGTQDSAWVVRGGSFRFNRCFHRIFVRQRETVAREDLGFRCAYAER